MDTLNYLIDSYDMPVLTAFLLGVLTSISPCPLATNITAIAYISRDIKSPSHTLTRGLSYTLGRGISYTALATLIYLGFSSFEIEDVFQGWGDKVLGPLLIATGLVMLGVVRIRLGRGGERGERLKKWLAQKGNTGALLLGMLFALAFCPYSGVLFFGALVPLILSSEEGLLLPPFFALGTSLLVVVFALLLAFSLERVGRAFQLMQKLEKGARYAVAAVFLVVGIYYTQYLFSP